MTDTESAQLVAMLSTAFPTPAWTDDTLEIYCSQLVDLEFAPAKNAIMRLLRTLDGFHPSISAIRTAVRQELERRGAIPTDLDSEEAWGYVMQQFSETGRYRKFPRTHEIVANTVACIGWEVLCDSENPEASRAHFWRVYAALLERARSDRLSVPTMRLDRDAERLLVSSGPTRIRDLIKSVMPKLSGKTGELA